MRNFEIKYQNGRSMIEMLGVLAIIGVLSVGGIAGYSKAMMKHRINKTIEQITLIAGNVHAFWGPQKNYIGVRCYCNSAGCYGQSSGDGCPIVKKAKIFPDEMITINAAGKITSITNPFGGGVSLAEEEDNKAFSIAYYDIPDEVCIELLTYDWTVANINIITISDDDGALHDLKVPVSVEGAVNMCTNRYDTVIMFFADSSLSGEVK
ncbi:MAG: hypothetical protein IJ525_01520 [Alphaproteobacteria bacterium]|nr:hypothetical protein [Alphaproteobacteria bacterium]